MRSRAPQLFAVAAACALLQLAGSGQISMRPTPEPLVTAENEAWYLAGEAITFAGNIYYPTGPSVFFDPEEMVRSGDYRGIPLYSLTTIEPYSRVYVPIGTRWMKPYERRRSGDLAGTSGSVMPSIVTPSPYEPWTQDEVLAGVARAPAPPSSLEPSVGTGYSTPVDTPLPAPPEPVSTTGAAVPVGPLLTARVPQGLNDAYLEFRDQRWFSSGPAVELEGAGFSRVGEYHGFPVYRRSGDASTIYVTVSRGAGQLVAPYSIRR